MATFGELGLNEEILKSVEELGFTQPTPIQEKAIPVLLSGTKDLIGLAQTGTGKTAAFGLPLLQLIDSAKKYPQALIVCPTRELCLQIVSEVENFKKHTRNVHLVAVYGGSSITQQIRDIRRGVHVVVATPGRLIDLIERKAINLEEISYVVLDEADEMLNMGFQDDIEFILQNTPKRESTWLFSATMPPEIRNVSKRYMKDPFEITVGKKNTANKNVDHQFVVTAAHHRYETLKRLIDFNPGMYGIIFTRTKADAQEIAEKLTREGYDIDALHGDLTQQQRNKVMDEFREKTLQLLIATDVAARGIDVQGITHVINYELPDDIEVYTHRSGRTGRAGKTGVCISIVHVREAYRIRDIERMVQVPFHKLEIPSGKDVCRKQFFYFMDKLLATDISHGDYESYLPMLAEKFADISKEEVLKRVAALEFDRFLKYYENAEDLNVRERRDDRRGSERQSDRGGERRRDTRGREFGGGGNTTRLFVNLGTKDGFYKASFLQFILDMSDLGKDVLGRIDMKEMNSWVEVEKGAAQKMMQAIDGKKYKGRRIRMNEADSVRR
ncbi:DEAD/DEAH box helicase [Flavisolibacter ginsenosidimutans]|uniref:DEAD-box ATP-dependent RNA helicase RhpA n=1 Tax=Flavisolibacter ginsenosidimutans TaxID=661481 RepID=A0A5B8UP41_9BACT|nr:DEAD/DEAH box helicase [Flavisolibacter ginsenosidimutans]QEC58226.1 DEAD/DEAH box helicase [Flavisolibacter ginsenosidimutans]